MSGNAPANPNTPRKPATSVPRPPLSRFRPSYVATGIALATTAYFYFNVPPSPRETPALTISTPGMKNIEKAYTNAGATPTHTKAFGGTTQGKKDSVALRDGGAVGGTAGVNDTGSRQQERDGASPYSKQGMGDDQRPAGNVTKAGEIWDQSMLGSSKGK